MRCGAAADGLCVRPKRWAWVKRNMACVVAFIGIFYVVGFWLLASAGWSAWRSSRAANWPTVPAAITRVEIKENHNSDGATYEVEVRYTYTVNGVAYEGSRLAFGYEASGNRLTHDEIHRKLKEAKAVSVRYDPSDPTVSCL